MKYKITSLLVLLLLLPIVAYAAQGDYWTGGYDRGNSCSDWRIDSNHELIPGKDDTYDIGTSSLEVKDAYIDGTAYIDNFDNISTTGNFSVTGSSTLGAAVIGSYETVTCTDGDPQGTGTLSTSNLISFVVTDTAGASADSVTLATTTATAGQIKIVVLKTDGEGAGLEIVPAGFGGGTNVLLEDAGDGVTFVFDGTNWQLCESAALTIQ